MCAAIGPQRLSRSIRKSVIQGAFILAKAKGSAAVAAESLDHLRRYFQLLLAKPAGSQGPQGPIT